MESFAAAGREKGFHRPQLYHNVSVRVRAMSSQIHQAAARFQVAEPGRGRQGFDPAEVEFGEAGQPGQAHRKGGQGIPAQVEVPEVLKRADTLR